MIFVSAETHASPAAIYNLGTLGGSFSQAAKVSVSGQVVGSSNIITGGPQHAFLYAGMPGSGGHMIDLGTLGGTTSFGEAINDGGQIAGYSYPIGDAALHAFLYSGTPG